MHGEIDVGVCVGFGAEFQAGLDFRVRDNELRVKLIPQTFGEVGARFGVENGATDIRNDDRIAHFQLKLTIEDFFVAHVKLCAEADTNTNVYFAMHVVSVAKN